MLCCINEHFDVEIVSGHGFQSEDNIFVEYRLLWPHHWSMRLGNLSDSIHENDLKRMAQENRQVVSKWS